MAEESFAGECLKGANEYFQKSLMSTLVDGTYFSLSPQAITSLDILPKLRPDGTADPNTANISSRSNTTVYSVLNKCRTTPGQRLLAVWLANPLISKEKIDLRLEIVQHLVDNTEIRTLCYDDYLRKVPDLLRIAYKLSKERCNLNDLMKLYNSVKLVQTLCKSFQQSLHVMGTTAPEAVHKLFKWSETTCEGLSDFVKLIEDSIDVDNVDEAGDYLVKPDSDEDIAKVTLEISSLCTQARRQLSHAASDIGLEVDKTIKLETEADKGFALKVTKNNEQAVRGNHDYEQLSLVKKDGYRFTNRALSKLSAKYVNAKSEYNTLAKGVIEDIISRAVMYDNEALEFTMSITLIDVFVAMAVTALQNCYVKPLILEQESGKIDIDKFRHPCIENQPDIDNFVPNSIVMQKDAKKFYIITGPNMGGKSTFIKSVATCVVMAQCGSHIPADDAFISIIDGVYTRVGAGDRQFEGVSTFMEEMMDMSNIIQQATENSLVIIDELGRGTSTFDGFGLAWSISKHLSTKTKSYTLFATHFHELTELEDECSIVGNLHVKAVCEADRMTMLYGVDRGVCDESYGINVAEYTKFPETVVKAARDKLKQFEEVPGFSSKKEVREFVRSCVKEYLGK